MKFHLAEALQHKWVERPPAGWTASREVALLDRAEARILGYPSIKGGVFRSP